jgi:glycosyltransferase involved in cell wall biosynthesis
MGSTSPIKGLHHLVRIASLLRDEAVEWHLYGIDPRRTPTPYVERCLAEIRGSDLIDRIVWRGIVNDPGPAYERMHALLVPSERENSPRVAIEAMAHGVPVVAARVGGVPEVISDGDSGLLFTPACPEEAAARLRSLVNDPSLWEELSGSAVRSAERFDVTAIGVMLERFYADLLGDGAGNAASFRGARERVPMRPGTS